MSYFRRVSLNKTNALQHSDRSGSKTLLIVAPKMRDDMGPISPYSQELLERVLTRSTRILGNWREIIVANATTTVSNLVKHTDADHIALVGSNLAQVLCEPAKLPAGTNMMGIPVRYADRRWIGTLSFGYYGIGNRTSWKEASMLGHLYRHLELLRIGLPGWDDPQQPVKARLVRNESDWHELRNLFETKRTVAIDTETINLERIHNTVLTLQFGFDGITGWVVPVSHSGSELSSSLLREIIAYLKNYFERDCSDCVHVYANAVFDLHQLYTLLKLRWYDAKVYDVMLGEFGLDENRMLRPKSVYAKGESWGLARICLEYGMHHYIHAPVGKGERDQLSKVALEKVAEYGAIDVALPIRIMRMQRALAKYRNERHGSDAYKYFFDSVTQVDGVKLQQFVAMERNGIPIDRKYSMHLQGPSSPVLKEIRDAEEKFRSLPEVAKAAALLMEGKHVRQRALFGAAEKQSVYFDHRKPANRQILFINVMKLKPINVTDHGTPSIDDEFKKAYKDNPVVKAFTDIEEAEKMLATFVAGFYDMLMNNPDNRDGNIRTRYTWIIITGRSGSSKPNFQNMPSRNKKRAKIIKRQFIAKRGKLWVKRDFSAHEVRMTGVSAKDPGISKTFWKGMQTRLRYEMQYSIPDSKKEWWSVELKAADVHRQNAHLFYGVDPRNVSEAMRNSNKGVIFGSTYGMTMPSLGIKMFQGTVGAVDSEIEKTKERIRELKAQLKSNK